MSDTRAMLRLFLDRISVNASRVSCTGASASAEVERMAVQFFGLPDHRIYRASLTLTARLIAKRAPTFTAARCPITPMIGQRKDSEIGRANYRRRNRPALHKCLRRRTQAKQQNTVTTMSNNDGA